MKNILTSVLLGVTILILTGCYTQIATSNNNDYVYYNEEPIIIIDVQPPLPLPCPLPYIDDPLPPEEKSRVPKTRPSGNENATDDLRNTGSRNQSGRGSR